MRCELSGFCSCHHGCWFLTFLSTMTRKPKLKFHSINCICCFVLSQQQKSNIQCMHTYRSQKYYCKHVRIKMILSDNGKKVYLWQSACKATWPHHLPWGWTPARKSQPKSRRQYWRTLAHVSFRVTPGPMKWAHSPFPDQRSYTKIATSEVAVYTISLKGTYFSASINYPWGKRIFLLLLASVITRQEEVPRKARYGLNSGTRIVRVNYLSFEEWLTYTRVVHRTTSFWCIFPSPKGKI